MFLICLRYELQTVNLNAIFDSLIDQCFSLYGTADALQSVPLTV